MDSYDEPWFLSISELLKFAHFFIVSLILILNANNSET
jgi:hypothetical protein